MFDIGIIHMIVPTVRFANTGESSMLARIEPIVQVPNLFIMTSKEQKPGYTRLKLVFYIRKLLHSE
jgi:hypothetical protein